MKERKEHAVAGEIGIAALALERKLDVVRAFAYRVIFDQQSDGVIGHPSDDEAIRQIRRAAKQLSFANGHVPITNLGTH